MQISASLSNALKPGAATDRAGVLWRCCHLSLQRASAAYHADVNKFPVAKEQVQQQRTRSACRRHYVARAMILRNGMTTFPF
jgi:hypothetical protein